VHSFPMSLDVPPLVVETVVEVVAVVVVLVTDDDPPAPVVDELVGDSSVSLLPQPTHAATTPAANTSPSTR